MFTGILMRTAPANVQALIEPAVASMGYELVGVEYLTQGKNSVLRVYIDRESGVNLDDCAKVSHQISGLLDVEDVVKGHYNLEISSPGLDRPLFNEAHFTKYLGRRVKLLLSVAVDGRRKFKGQLLEFSEGMVVLEVDGEQTSIPFAKIDRANLIPEF